jgi:hypothetical protein
MPLPYCRSRTWMLFLGLLLAGFVLQAPLVAAQPPPLPPQSDLSPQVRDRLTEAAQDAALAPWQREFMLGVAGDGVAGAAGPPSPALADIAPVGTAADDGAWADLSPPSRRDAHTAIYDPVRDRMVVFGGEPFTNDVWALSLAGTPAWAQLTPTGSPPSARRDHTAIYDPVRDCMVVFGGLGPSLNNDVWALSLSGSPAWSELTPAGSLPPARFLQTAIYDPVRDRMVVFGGYDGASPYHNDVWALSLAGTPTWAQLTPTGSPPSARGGHTAIYDPVRDRMVVFGGSDAVIPYRNDVWALSLAGSPAWSALTPAESPPPGRYAHTAIYDPVRDRMVVFGGTGSARVNDVWALSFAGTPAWAQLTPTGSPPSARREHTAIYDPVRDRMVVFGGNDGSLLNDAWALSLAGSPAWSALGLTGGLPPARFSHTAIYDPVRERMVVFGGFDGFLNDVWALSLAGTPAWSALTPAGSPPSARYGHTAIYDPVRDRMVVFGGNGPGLLNDVWALSLAGSPAWSALTTAGSAPSARGGHTAIYDPVRDRMVVFGGYDNISRINDVWALSLAGSPAWSALAPTGSPPAGRYAHTAIYDPVRDRMVVFGGADDTNLRNDVWALSLAGSPAWSPLAPGGSPPDARNAHTAIYDPVRDRIVVFGGYDGSFRNDVLALSLAGSPDWSALTPGGSPPPGRYGHTAIFDPVRDRMVVFGGYDGVLDDLWTLTWADASTAVLASLVSVDAQASRVRLVWYVSGTGGPDARLYRRRVDSDWTFVDRIATDGTGYVRYEDEAVTSGTRYGYRLGIIDAGEEVFAGEVWADVPTPDLPLAMRGLTPNPSIDGRLRVEFSLQDASPARLELIDVMGRVLSSKQVGALGPGTHSLELSEGGTVQPGVYFLRLTQGQHEVLARAAVFR